MKNELLICECSSPEHQIILSYDYDEDKDGNKIPMCYAHIHLNKLSFWKRIKYGIMYIFGYQCNYGAFQEFIFDSKDVSKLQELTNYLKENEIQST
jgi:hypothetical protein